MQKASIGRIVHVLIDPSHNNGIDVAPAIVTRAWGEPAEHNGAVSQCINVRVHGDSAETLWLTSIYLFEERPTDEELAERNPYNPHGYRAVAFWPPRD